MIIEKIDGELTQIANVAPDIIGKDFFEMEHSKGKITPEENAKNARILSEYAKKMGAVYVYTIALKNGELYYTSSSSTDEEWQVGDVTPYFYSLSEYGDSNIEILKSKAANLKPVAITGSDSYGNFRSVYIPLKNSRGEINIVGADYRLADINRVILTAAIFALLNMLYIVLALLPLFFTAKKVLISYISEISKRATTDELTGLYNRAEVFNMLGKYIEMSNRSENSLALCYIDIDNLKKINDEFGHDAGDAMLRCFSEILKNDVRKYDITSRIGGDEFLVLFPSCSLRSAREIIERVRERFGEEGKAKGVGEMYDFSYGLSEYSENEDIDVDKLVKIADNRMYQNKIIRKYNKKIAENLDSEEY